MSDGPVLRGRKLGRFCTSCDTTLPDSGRCFVLCDECAAIRPSVIDMSEIITRSGFKVRRRDGGLVTISPPNVFEIFGPRVP